MVKKRKATGTKTKRKTAGAARTFGLAPRGDTEISPRGSNFQRLKAAGLLLPDFEFSAEDRRAIESLSSIEVDNLIRMAHKVAPNLPREYGAVRGIVL